MGGYIQLRKKRVRDPRLYQAGTRLSTGGWKISAPDGSELSRNETSNALSNALRGVTTALWAYADEHLRSDDTLRVTLDALASILGCPVEWLRELPPDWLQETPDGFIKLPDYCAANGLRGKDLRSQDVDEKRQHERELNAERQQRHRDKIKREKLAGQTSRSSNGVTPPTGTGTGTLTLPVPEPGSAPGTAGQGAAPAPGPESPEVSQRRRELRDVVAGIRAEKVSKP